MDIVLVLLLALLYVVTLLPGVGYSGDTAGFQFIGRVLGIPHPTGYPLYTLLNHVFVQFVPFGSHAYRANLLSAVLAVLSCLALKRLLCRIGLSPGTAFLAALTYGVSRSFWSQAVVAEVYTLNILFVVLVLDRLVAWQNSRNARDLLTACAVYALSFGNHLTMILLLPGFVAFVWCVDRRVFRNPRLAAAVAALVLAGSLQYLYLIVRTRDASLLYSEMFPGGFRDFLVYITGGPFRARMLSSSIPAVVTSRFPSLAKLFARDLLILVPLVPFGILGVRNRPLNWLLGLTGLASALYGLEYNVDDVWVFFLPLFLIAFIYAAIPLDRLRSRFAGDRGAGGLSKRRAAGYALMALIPVGFLAVNYTRVDRSHDVANDRAVVRALATAGDHALILSPKTMISEFFWYYLIGEGVEKEKEIYLVHHVRKEEIAEYLRHDRTFTLPEERRAVPPDLNVYDWRASHRQDLESVGLTLEFVDADLYRVTVR